MNPSPFYAPGEGGADVPEGAPFDAWRIRILERSEFDALGRGPRPSSEQLAYFAAWSLLAPTTHNTVPQRYRLRPEEGALSLFVDRRAVLPESDPTGRQTLVSLGCVAQNALRAAEAYGFSGRVELAPEADEGIRPAAEGAPHLAPALTLRFSRSEAAANSPQWLEAMRRRKMVRAEYDEGVAMPDGLAADLAASVKTVHAGLTLHLLTDAPSRIFLGKFQELADSTVINRERFARELGDWLLPDDSEATVGMRGREFGLSARMSERMHRGLRGQERLLPDETAGFAKAGHVGMRSASAVAVITAAKDDAEHRVAAGRAFEDVALRLSGADLCCAMHAGITEVEAPNMALRGRLRTLQRPTVVFRVGRPLHPEDGRRPHAARPPLQSLWVP